ncbi:MAG: hypothetical protein E3J35_08550 [Methanomassiliicoccales archaeon]|nr:MAG: hypothetical protein E3J35_08550 [Methanomassiliicoccales archaeon]
MEKGRYQEMAKRIWAIALVEVLFAAVLVGLVPVADAHSGDEIYSVWTTTPPTIDGAFPVGEWADATIVDLSAIAGNNLGSYLYVANNDSHLFVAYDAYGDITDDVGDAASISFDTDHDGAGTDGGDDQFVIYGDGTTQHYEYSSGTGLWQVHCSPFDSGLANHTDLAGAEGFGISPNSGTDHRIFELSIPFALLNVSLGDTVGFFAGSLAVPGVTNTGFLEWDTWPVHGFVALNQYGNLVLGTQEGVSITPKYQSQPAEAGTVASYILTITNRGMAVDIFDLSGASTMGWTAAFFDSSWNLLTDTGGSPDIDTGSVPSRSWVDIFVNISVPMGASLGDFDLRTVTATSSNNASVGDTAALRTGVPVTPNWIDDMEGGSDGWYLPAGANDWEHGIPNWVWGPATAYSPVNAWGTNLTGNYSHGSNSFLYSPYINLTAPIEANMSFWHWYDISGGWNDGGWVDISTDHGETWNTITPEGGYTDTTILGRPCYAGSSGNWVPAEFNLTSYIGNTILLRFQMWDNTADASELAGWYIDNVAVNATYMTAGVRVTPESQNEFGKQGTIVSYALTVTNIGTGGSDIFDITSMSSLGWTAAFYDSGWNLLTDTGGSPDVDTGTITFGDSRDIYVNITIPGGANPGDIDVTNVVATSANNPTANDTGTLWTQVAYPTPYFDDMESGTDGWIYDVFWHQVYNETTAPPWNMSHSPSYSWWYGQDMVGHYDNGAINRGYLTSPPIDLTAATDAELEFAYLYETESMGTLFDQRWVQIRMGDNPWQGLEQLFGDSMGTWILKTIDLTPYVGDIVQIRYYFDTINDLNNNYRGWYIDDVSVVEAGDKPIVKAWEPGGTFGQNYTIGTLITVTWSATDNQPMPADNVNTTFGAGGSWTEINGGIYSHANDGVEVWDSTGAMPGIYSMNISAYDSDSQTTYDFSNHTFELLGPDTTPPEIEYVLLDGLPTSFAPPGSLVVITAMINDSAYGGSNIEEAEWMYSCGPWPGNAMLPQDGNWDDTIETAVDNFIAPMMEGTYYLYVRARDAANNWNESCEVRGTLIVHIDDILPPKIFSPRVNGQMQIRIKPGTPVLLTATIDDTDVVTSNVSSAQYMINPPSALIDMIASDGAFGQPVEDVEANVNTAGWLDGTYDLCIYASDDVVPPNVNNTGTACAVIIVDGTPPDILNVNVPATVINGTIASLNATIDDTGTGGSNIKSANFTYGTQVWPGTSMNAVNPPLDSQTENVFYSIQTGTFPYYVGTNHVVCVYANDTLENNNTNGPCVTFDIIAGDDQAPEISNVLVDGAPFIQIAPGSSFTLNATVDDGSTGNSDVANASYLVRNSSQAYFADGSMNALNPPFDNPLEDVTLLISTMTWPLGDYTIHVLACDAATLENCNYDEALEATVRLSAAPPDNEPPEIMNVQSDVTSFEVETRTTINITATVDDSNTPTSNPSPIASANYTIGSANWPGLPMDAEDGGYDEVTELVKKNITVSSWVPGTYQIFVYASDISNNDNTTSIANVTIVVTPADNTRPTIANERIDPTDPEPDEEVTISANVTDDRTSQDDLVVEVTITYPDGQDQTYDMTFNSDTGDFEYTSTFTAEGSYSVSINATDEAGNYRTTEISGGFTVTEVPPPPPKEDAIPLWVWLLIIFIIIIVIAVIAIAASRRKPEEAEPPVEEAEEESPAEEVLPEEEAPEDVAPEEVSSEDVVEETSPAE